MLGLVPSSPLGMNLVIRQDGMEVAMVTVLDIAMGITMDKTMDRGIRLMDMDIVMDSCMDWTEAMEGVMAMGTTEDLVIMDTSGS